ncbi:MAG TPA: YetF domain-containing protein [Noviherbaspirillum sp.]
MFFDSWDSIYRIVIIGVLAYAGTVVLMRLSGNRTLSKMNSFDLVVTIAFGSTLASVLIDDKISLAEGLAAIGMLVALQFVITWASVRSRYVNAIIKTQPTLLVSEGRFLRDAMKKVRVTEDEVRSVVRQHGLGGLDQVAAVVLETDGSMSVISSRQRGTLDALQGVQGQAAKENGSS